MSREPNSRNPNVQSERRGQKARQHSRINRGVVTRVPSDGSLAVQVKILGDDEHVIADVPQPSDGDWYLPPEGTIVYTRQRTNERHTVMGIPQLIGDSTPNLSAGERRLSHPLSSATVDFNGDGSITVTADDGTTVDVQNGQVRVNGGSTGVIKEISTTKDADGHVTDVSYTRSSKLYVP